MLPIDMTADFGKWIGYLTFFGIGMGFGSVLEMAGFGDSRKLAAQFYFKDMTVLKTMFTGIVVAVLLIFFFSSLGLLDFSQLFVNQTYLWPGIVGGLIMGVGFILGGYCPGTSIVSTASLKLDGMVFFVGTMLGAGLFGESVFSFSDFWNSSFTERLLVSDWLGWSIGATVTGVVFMALVFFYLAEKTEEFFKLKTQNEKINWKPSNKIYIGSGFFMVLLALFIWAKGQPTPEQKWNRVGSQFQSLIENRDIFIHPLEFVKTWNDASVKLITLDFRSESEFEKFHLDSAVWTRMDDLKKQDFIFKLSQLPANSVVVVVADQESIAVQAWKWLKVQGVGNLYVLDQGLNDWQKIFSNIHLEHGPINLSRPPTKVLELFPVDTFKTKIKLKTTKKGGGLCS